MKCNSNYCSIKEGFTDLLKGEKGIQGPDGVQGHVGDTGLRGLDGPIGYQGLDGDQGIPGVSGFKGNQGEQGKSGLPGPRGDKGAKGQIGPRGAKGPKGPKGPRGPPGDRADRGPGGGIGPIGPTGDSGIQFSNIGINSDDACKWQTTVDYNDQMDGARSRSYNFCGPGYGIAGIKTFGWDNQVKRWAQMQSTDYWGHTTYWTTSWRPHPGTQVQRKYDIKCCPVLSADDIVADAHSDNLDDYKNFDSIRKYPFHKP